MIPCWGGCDTKFYTIDVLNGKVMQIHLKDGSKKPICSECMEGVKILRKPCGQRMSKEEK